MLIQVGAIKCTTMQIVDHRDIDDEIAGVIEVRILHLQIATSKPGPRLLGR
jgi:hypothetical protein